MLVISLCDITVIGRCLEQHQPTVQVTREVLNVLIAILKRERTGEINFNKIFHLAQFIQNTIVSHVIKKRNC